MDFSFLSQIWSTIDLGFLLFVIGVFGIFTNRKNILVILMSVEIMLLAVNYNFLLTSVRLDDLEGQIFTILVLTVAAAESAIGLALLMVYFRVRGSIGVDFVRLIKG